VACRDRGSTAEQTVAEEKEDSRGSHSRSSPKGSALTGARGYSEKQLCRGKGAAGHHSNNPASLKDGKTLTNGWSRKLTNG